MKTAKILGATTLAGALLFTGVGATHSYEAHASEVQKVTLATPDKWQKQHDKLLEARLHNNGHQFGEGGGPGAINSYQTSYQDYVNRYLQQAKKYGNVEYTIPPEGKAYLNGQNNQNTNGTTAQDNNQGQSSQATSNAKSENKTQSQNQSQALPETGEETSNTTLVTMIASVILAAGSLLAFRRTSKSNK